MADFESDKVKLVSVGELEDDSTVSVLNDVTLGKLHLFMCFLTLNLLIWLDQRFSSLHVKTCFVEFSNSIVAIQW